MPSFRMKVENLQNETYSSADCHIFEPHFQARFISMNIYLGENEVVFLLVDIVVELVEVVAVVDTELVEVDVEVVSISSCLTILSS